jgi:hypothetical protein
LALWRVAEAFLSTLHMLFGAPEEVAAKHTLTAKAHALMASWLRCAEAMLRRLAAPHSPRAADRDTETERRTAGLRNAPPMPPRRPAGDHAYGRFSC